MRDAGVAVSGEIEPYMAEAARRAVSLSAVGGWAMTAVVLLLALGGAALAWRRTDGDFRARNAVERVVLGLLIAAACIAILTTLGIVLSLIFNTLEFFKLYPASDFFFGTTWSPSFGGGSELGIWPLLWGTLYIFIGFAGWRVWRSGLGAAHKLWWLQLALNFAWPPVFFSAHTLGAALIVILALDAAVVAFMAATWRTERISALLFLPYLAWVAYASLLNAALWWLN